MTEHTHCWVCVRETKGAALSEFACELVSRKARMASRGRERRGSTSRLVADDLIRAQIFLTKTHAFVVVRLVGYLLLRRVSASIPPNLTPRKRVF